MDLRVAYVVSHFPKVSETFIVDEVRALERAGAHVEIFALRRGQEPLVQSDSKRLAERAHYPGRALACALDVARQAIRRPLRLLSTLAVVLGEHLRSPGYLAHGLGAWLFAVCFTAEIERSGARHVHAHWATHTATSAWVVSRLSGLSFSFTAHADDIFVPRPMLRRKLADAAFVVTISEFARRFLAERAPAGEAARIEVVHCGLDLRAFEPTPLPEGDRLEIACVARLEPKKGIADLVDAVALLRDRGVDARCRILGDGRERATLEARIERRGLGDRVELLGVCPREQVGRVVAASHVCALPAIVDAEGRADGIPVALIEAQALGRPCVATNVSGIPELIEDGRSGLLVAPGDPDAIAGALARIDADRALAARLGAAGRERVEADFDIDRSAARLTALMREASARSAHAPRVADVVETRPPARRPAS
jgi:glycosyltransferase involved in cell wall biosynthesis